MYLFKSLVRNCQNSHILLLLRLKYKEWIDAFLLMEHTTFPLFWLMKSKLLFMVMMVVVDGGGDDNGDYCCGEIRLKTN